MQRIARIESTPLPSPDGKPQLDEQVVAYTHRAFAEAFNAAVAGGDQGAEDELFYHYRFGDDGLVRFANDARSIAICRAGRAGAVKVFIHGREDSVGGRRERTQKRNFFDLGLHLPESEIAPD